MQSVSLSSFKTFSSPRETPCTHEVIAPIPTSSTPLSDITRDLPIWDRSDKRSQTVCVTFCQGRFSQMKCFPSSFRLAQISEVPPFLRPNSIPLYVYTTLWFIHSSTDGHLGCFHLLAVMNNAAVSTVCKFLCGHMSSFLLGI